MLDPQTQPGADTEFETEPSVPESSDKGNDKTANSSLATASDPPSKSLGLLFSSYGFVTSIGVFQDYYEAHFLHDYSPSEISWILSIQAFFVSASAPFAGVFFDRNGPHLLVGLGSVLIILGLFTLSVSTQYYQIFLSQSVSCGLGMGMIFHGSVNSVATWFLKKRGLALGIASSGSGVGGVLLPLEHEPKPFNLTNFSKPFEDKVFALNSLACLAGMLGTLIPFNYLKVASQAASVSPNLATYLLPIVNASSIIGRIVPLWAGDHLGPFNTTASLMLYDAILVLALWIPAAANSNAIIAFTALFGVPLGCFNAVIPALVGRISTIEEIGFRVGTTFFVVSIAALIGNPIAGLLIGQGWEEGPESYHGLKLFCGLSIAVSGLLFLVTRVQIGGYRLNKRI
ncbi:hypothetical protein EKO27_g753 [Xylaria grammica]|uniref:Major facilitator superfamily (MFS) profile domain-containing protein n=1 Tax=Xylaria grammica TaxID=363999 RepID=A0A439DIZ6_9PEZI|nr:hypothetical protein EKO27_g753 [Xylaria grammica]